MTTLFLIHSFAIMAAENLIPAENLLMTFEQVHYSENSHEVLESLIQLSEPYTLGSEKADPKVMTLLQAHNMKAKNYLAITKQFDECLANSKQNLKARIINQSGSESVITFLCHERTQFDNLGLNDFIDRVQDIAQTSLNGELFEKVFDQNLEQAIGSLVDLDWRHSDGKLDSQAYSRLVCTQTCPRCGNRCTNSMKKRIDRIAAKWKSDSKNTPRWNLQETTLKLNEIIQKLNEDPEKNRDLLLVSPGSLLFTDHLADAAGALENIKKKKLKKIKERDVKKAVLEVRKSLVDMAQDLSTMDKTREVPKNRDNSLKLLVKRSPAALGKVLIKSPELAGRVCNIIEDMQQDDLDTQKYYKWGGGIVAGALIIGTVATFGAGAVFLLPATAMGSLTTSALLTTGTVSFGIGGVVAGGIETSKSIQRYQENDQFEQAIYANLGDRETITDAQEALKEFYKARKNATLEFGTTLIPLTFLRTLSKLGHLKQAATLIQFILQSPKLLKLLHEVNSKYGPAKLQELFMKLVALGPKALEQLNKMKNWTLKDVFAFMKWPFSWLKNQQYRFWTSFGIKTPHKFFIKPREEYTTTAAKLSDLGGYLSGKILRVGQLRAHITVVSGSAIMGSLISKGEENLRVDVEDKRPNTPGYDYVNSFAEQDVLEPFERDSLINDHDIEIGNWSANPDKYFPKKLKELIRLGYVNDDEALALSRLAKRAYSQALKTFHLARSEKPDLTATEHLKSVFFPLLEIDPLFLAKPDNVKEALYTFFDPLIILNGHSDLEIFKLSSEILQKPLAKLDSDEDFKIAGTKFIAKAISEGAPFEKGLLMMSQTLENPNTIKEKFAKAKAIFPKEKGYLGLRVDIPRREGAKKLLGVDTPIEDELDVWKIFINDPRFEIYKEKWLSGEISDTQALEVAYQQIEALNALIALSGEWKKREPPEPTRGEIDYLFGISNLEDGNPLLLPVGQPIYDHIYELSKNENDEATKADWGEKFFECLKGGAVLWGQLYVDESNWIKANPGKLYKKFSDKLVESYQDKFEKYLASCK